MKTKSPNQSGSILIPALVGITVVGSIAASVNTLLITNTENVNEQVRHAQGFSVADSYRLALEAGASKDDARDMIQSEMYPGIEKKIETTEPLSGAVVIGTARYGYRFGDPNPFSDFKNQDALGVCTTRRWPNRVVCTWTSDTVVDDPIKIDSDTVFVIRDGITVTFNKPLYIDGDLKIRQNRSRGSSNNICFREWVEVTGDLNTTSLKIQEEADSCSDGQSRFNALFLGDLTVDGKAVDDHDYGDDDDDDDSSSDASWDD